MSLSNHPALNVGAVATAEELERIAAATRELESVRERAAVIIAGIRETVEAVDARIEIEVAMFDDGDVRDAAARVLCELTGTAALNAAAGELEEAVSPLI